jgi:hypothetical protein
LQRKKDEEITLEQEENMKRFARALAVTLGLVVLSSFVLLFPQKNASGTTSGAPVSVVNTPLPVSGNVNVGGSVGITGTPNVSVTNSPTVNLASGNSVNVGNPLDASNNPVPLATLDALQPYEDSCQANFLNVSNRQCNFQTIPVGKRLVIQEVDANIVVSTAVQPQEVIFQTDNTKALFHFFAATHMSSSLSGDNFAAHQETRLYVGPNQTPQCSVSLTAGSAGGFACQFSGFLVDVPVS